MKSISCLAILYFTIFNHAYYTESFHIVLLSCCKSNHNQQNNKHNNNNDHNKHHHQHQISTDNSIKSIKLYDRRSKQSHDPSPVPVQAEIIRLNSISGYILILL